MRRTGRPLAMKDVGHVVQSFSSKRDVRSVAVTHGSGRKSVAFQSLWKRASIIEGERGEAASEGLPLSNYYNCSSLKTTEVRPDIGF